MLRYAQLKAAPELVVSPTDTPDQTVPIQLSGGNGQVAVEHRQYVEGLPSLAVVEICGETHVRSTMEPIHITHDVPHKLDGKLMGKEALEKQIAQAILPTGNH